MSFNNAVNANQTGIQALSSVGAWTGSTVTQNGVLYGGASNAVSSLAVAATGTVMIGNTGAAPSFSATPAVTSITLSGGTPLSVYAEGTFTPTLEGSGTAGTTTYTNQYGYYTRIGNIVIAQFNLEATSGATAAGSADIGGLPFTVKNQTFGSPTGAALIYSSLVWPVGTSMATLEPIINTTIARIYCSGTASAGALMDINALVLFKIYGNLIYQV